MEARHWDPEGPGTPAEGAPKEEPRVESAKAFPISWGERIILCKLTWGGDDGRITEFCPQAGTIFAEEEKKQVHKFLSKVDKGTKCIDAQAVAETHFPAMDRLLNWPQAWPWRTTENTLCGWATSYP